MSRHVGFTLLELLMALTIIAITLAFAFPAYKTFFETSKAEVVSAQLLHAINLTRQEAMLQGKVVTLGKRGDHWQDGQIVFIAPAEILYVFDVGSKGVLHWRSSLNRDYLEVLPSGFTNEEEGTFWFCAPHAKTPAWAIVVNKAARAYLINDITNSPMRSLSCSAPPRTLA